MHRAAYSGIERHTGRPHGPPAAPPAEDCGIDETAARVVAEAPPGSLTQMVRITLTGHTRAGFAASVARVHIGLLRDVVLYKKMKQLGIE